MSGRAVRLIEEHDSDAAMAIRGFAYGHPRNDEHRSFLERNAPHILGSFQDGELVSVATMWPFTAYVGGARKPLGGLASVATAPTARRRGHVATLLRAWFERLRDAGVGLCAESPFDPRFYARYGFQSVVHGHLLELPIETLGPAEAHDARWLDPGEHAEIAAIHAAFARRYSLALTRDDGTRGGMDYATRPPGLEDQVVTALLEDAYACVWVDREPEEPYLFVRDFAYSSPAGRRRLWSFLAGFAGQVGSVLVMLPPGEPLAALYADRYPRRMTGLQVRVVDLPLALAGLRARTEAEFVLALRDPDCPWQDGAFRVRLGPDGCEARPLAGAADPDVSLGPLGLAAVLFGAQDPASTLATGTAEGDLGALEALAGVLAGHPVYMPRADHF